MWRGWGETMIHSHRKHWNKRWRSHVCFSRKWVCMCMCEGRRKHILKVRIRHTQERRQVSLAQYVSVATSLKLLIMFQNPWPSAWLSPKPNSITDRTFNPLTDSQNQRAGRKCTMTMSNIKKSLFGVPVVAQWLTNLNGCRFDPWPCSVG